MRRVQCQHIGQRALEIHRRAGEGLSQGPAEAGLEHDFPAVEDGIVRACRPAYGLFRGEAAAFQADAAFVQMVPCDGIAQCLPEPCIQGFFRHHAPYLRRVVEKALNEATGGFLPERRPPQTYRHHGHGRRAPSSCVRHRCRAQLRTPARTPASRQQAGPGPSCLVRPPVLAGTAFFRCCASGHARGALRPSRPASEKGCPLPGQPQMPRFQARGARPDCRLRSCRRLRALRLTRTIHEARTTTAMPTSARRTREALKCCSKPHRAALSHAGW